MSWEGGFSGKNHPKSAGREKSWDERPLNGGIILKYPIFFVTFIDDPMHWGHAATHQP